METEGVLMGDYTLQCMGGGETVDDHFALKCGNGHNGLLRAIYNKKQIEMRPYGGMFKFLDWLPTDTILKTESAPITFRNRKISKELGLKNLYIGFTGYYPERNAKVKSCTFKEMEALPTYARLIENGGGTVVVASAGNTARAFAQIAAEVGMDCIVVVPKLSADDILVAAESVHVKLFTVDGDYADATQMANRITSFEGYIPEGGASNIARRDGMGTVMLDGAISAGRIPDRYFQAVGSGTGGISAWEASLRLLDDGRYGDRLPKLELAQNAPFTPMAKAWNAGRREITAEDLGNADKDISNVYAHVLTNRRPPYSVAGGVFDAMTACGGGFHEISNDEARSAEKLWISMENVKPDPAASVAFAALIKATEYGKISPDECVFLNMTGGGLDRAKEDLSLAAMGVTSELSMGMTDTELRKCIDV
ncbi:MAG: cysteate synthase [Sphaerochaetaceae bacterium]